MNLIFLCHFVKMMSFNTYTQGHVSSLLCNVNNNISAVYLEIILTEDKHLAAVIVFQGWKVLSAVITKHTGVI